VGGIPLVGVSGVSGHLPLLLLVRGGNEGEVHRRSTLVTPARVEIGEVQGGYLVVNLDLVHGRE